MKTLLALPILLAAFALPNPAASAATAAPAPLAATATMATMAPAAASAGPAVPGDVRYPLRLEVDAGGTVRSVDSGDAVPDTLRAMVERAAARARFEPALRDGVPVPASLWVTARVGFEPSGPKVRARVVGLTAGGGVRLVAPKQTPMGTRARGYSADVWVRAVFDARGRLVEDGSGVQHVAMRTDPGVEKFDMLSSALSKRFRSGVERSMDEWTWTPDRIDGQPIGGVFRMPIGFPSARAMLAGQVLAPGSAEAGFVPQPGPGLTAAKLQPWAPLAAEAGGDGAPASP